MSSNKFLLNDEIKYGKYFESDMSADGRAKAGFPARETVQVSALPKFVNVEISMIAVK